MILVCLLLISIFRDKKIQFFNTKISVLDSHRANSKESISKVNRKPLFQL